MTNKDARFNSHAGWSLQAMEFRMVGFARELFLLGLLGAFAAFPLPALGQNQDEGEKGEKHAKAEEPGNSEEHPQDDKAPASAKPHLPHWSYAGEEGPAHWGSLDPAFAACATGQAQTPIDLKGLSPESSSTLVFEYRDSWLNAVNNGHTIQANFDLGSVISLDGKRFMLAQVHFHSPSEHTVAGRPYDLEAHLVHVNIDRELAVVGVFMKRGRENPALAKIWKNMPAQGGQSFHSAETDLNGEDFLPERRVYHRYRGSLTTPPCSEGVNWVVMVEPVELSAEQFDQFITVVGKNARPVQPLQGRNVIAGETR